MQCYCFVELGPINQNEYVIWFEFVFDPQPPPIPFLAHSILFPFLPHQTFKIRKRHNKKQTCSKITCFPRFGFHFITQQSNTHPRLSLHTWFSLINRWISSHDSLSNNKNGTNKLVFSSSSSSFLCFVMSVVQVLLYTEMGIVVLFGILKCIQRWRSGNKTIKRISRDLLCFHLMMILVFQVFLTPVFPTFVFTFLYINLIYRAIVFLILFFFF